MVSHHPFFSNLVPLTLNACSTRIQNGNICKAMLYLISCTFELPCSNAYLSALVRIFDCPQFPSLSAEAAVHSSHDDLLYPLAVVAVCNSYADLLYPLVVAVVCNSHADLLYPLVVGVVCNSHDDLVYPLVARVHSSNEVLYPAVSAAERSLDGGRFPPAVAAAGRTPTDDRQSRDLCLAPWVWLDFFLATP